MPSKSDFPGLQRQRRKDGSVALDWVRSPAARKAGYLPKTVSLDGFVDGSDELRERCQDLQAQMERWLANRNRAEAPDFDGTFGSLISIYETDSESPYQRFPRTSRTTVHYQLRLLRLSVGDRRLADSMASTSAAGIGASRSHVRKVAGSGLATPIISSSE